MREAVIVATARTPIGRAFKGSLIDHRPDDLATIAVQAALAKVPELDPHQVEDIMLGCGQPAGESGYNIARVVAVLCGLTRVPGCTVQRYCSSSLQTIRMAAHAIRAGEGDVFVAGGVETVSRFKLGKADGHPNTRNPLFDTARARTATREKGGAGPWTPAADGELPDIYIAMGQTAENVAEHYNISREDMDAYAYMSQSRTAKALERGFFAEEITPVPRADGTLITHDDSPRPSTTLEKLATLKPVFRPDGRITAGNACPLNDGAAAVVVMSAERAKALGIKPLARIVASAVTALDPEIMGVGPIEAIRACLKRASMTINGIDLVEINEAFAAQVIPSYRALDIDPERLNVNGGSIALGHPFGMTGA
ncbi:MAG: acetyl-CoA C-acetyltransferase, partial [Myxococcota bacterium]